MADYPGSVFAPPTRSNGQTIDASHVGNLQDEVTAIETMLLGTITHSLNVSGASTLATLQAGASTLASLVVSGGFTVGALSAGASTATSLSVSGGSTLGTIQAGASTLASLSVSGNSTIAELFVTASPPTARVTNSAIQQLAADAVTLLTFDTDRNLSTSTMHSTGSNPGRLIPPSTGLYTLAANVALSTGVLGARALYIRINGTTLVGVSQVESTALVTLNVATQYRFRVAGDYAEVLASMSNSTGRTLVSNDYTPDFMMTKIR